MNCNRVIILGIDGVGTAAKEVNTPNLDRIFHTGAHTYEAKASLPTISAECWGAILLGVEPEKHGMTNEIVSEVSRPADTAYPSLFTRIGGAFPGREMASFCSWDPINSGIIEQGTACHKVTLPDAQLAAAAAGYLMEHDPALLFLALDDCDGAGHTFDYFTEGHKKAVEQADVRVGLVLDALEKRGMWDDSLVIAVTDHGGGGETPRSHGSAHPQDQTVFWGCRGPGIVPGTLLQGPVRIADTAAVALHAMGVAIPAELDGRVPEGLFA